MAVKFTERAEKVLLTAGSESKKRGHDYVGTEHLLHAILKQQDSIALQALEKSEIEIDELTGLVSERLDALLGEKKPSAIPFTPHANGLVTRVFAAPFRVRRNRIGGAVWTVT
ncbi:MAG: Clp protease N-terminal domain-containing protein [Planctomycetota bacterium]